MKEGSLARSSGKLTVYQREHTISPVKHGGGSFILRRCLSSAGTGKLDRADWKMDEEKYWGTPKKNC